MPDAHAAPLRPAAFLDRDGTIIREREYLSDPAQVELLPGAARALRALRDAGYALVVVTNQSGIARGLYALEDYHAVDRRFRDLLVAQGAAPDAVYFCPHHPDFSGPCACRKPGTALYLQAAEELGLDLARSIWIGDRVSDVAAAATLGGRAILVRTGYGAAEETRAPAGVHVVNDLPEAARLFAAGLASFYPPASVKKA